MAGQVSGSRSASYATGLDGVRAIAVIAVLLYHAGVWWMPGGFTGVDLFFVVSGYLVTALLQREHDRTGRIDLAGFWQRRARRLLPALGAVLLVVSSITFLVGRDFGAGLRWQLLGAVSFSSNWWQVGQHQSYVDTMEPALLNHLWSLAVEEQFYLLWPFVTILLLGMVRSRRLRVGLVLALAVLSAGAMAWSWTGGDPTRIYVGTDTHGFGLLLGAALAFARPDSAVDPVRRTVRRSRAADVVGLVCLGVVLAGFLVLDLAWTPTFLGGLFLMTVAATGLVAMAVRPAGLVSRLLSAKLLRPVGLRSYSLYLWHWPALVCAWRVLGPEIGRVWATVAGLAVALVATELTWRFVETPVRRYGVRGALAELRRRLVRPRVAPARRSVAWLGTSWLAVLTVAAACGVVAAPARSDLELSLAAGQEALASASQAVPPPYQASSPVHTAPPVTVPDLPVTTPKNEPEASAADRRSTPTGSPAPSGPEAVRTIAAETESPIARSTETRPPEAPAAGPEPAITGDHVRAVGDSVMLASAPALLAALPGADIDAEVSRQLWDLPELLAGTERPYVVIGLGTNGTESPAAVLGWLSALPDSTVVVLVGTAGPQEWRDEVNEVLAEVAAQRPRTCLADWAAVIDGHDDHLASDRIHPDATAGGWYADLVVNTLTTCR